MFIRLKELKEATMSGNQKTDELQNTRNKEPQKCSLFKNLPTQNLINWSK